MGFGLWKAALLGCFVAFYLKEAISGKDQQWCILERNEQAQGNERLFMEFPTDDSAVETISGKLGSNHRPEMQGIYENPVHVEGQPLWDGDMLISPEQMKYLNSSEQEFGAATLSRSSRWPNGKIFYVIDRSVSHVKGLIQEAMAKWSRNTCITFLPVASDHSTNRVRFRKTGYGCFSHVGMLAGEQPLSVDPGCEVDKIIAHEMGHLIGLWHEQTRRDRDMYLVTYLRNVNEANQKNYDIPADFTSGDTPYDFGSIMHYDFLAFTKNKRYTMVSKNPFEEAKMFTSKQPSFYDLRIVNKIYDCTVPCASSPVRCRNDGFRTSNAKGECICVCRDDYDGKYCETKANLPSCNAKITEEGTIRSPYPFPTNWACVYWIQAPKHMNVRITFDKFFLKHCDDEYMKVRLDNADSDDPGLKYCGRALKGKTLQSLREQVILLLKTGPFTTPGFSATVTFV